ncbi:MAG TPA: hypothetical protein VK973_13840 [Arenicellales bacterium]|nr:hypothetical protein [Arenicellales bacterium]
MADRALLFWSSGKDSAAALQAVRGELEIEALVTTVNRPGERVAVHNVPEVLLDRQAASMGLPLEKIVIPDPCPNMEYERRILDALRPYRERGVRSVVFGDINLEDIRAYREALLSRARMRCLFPLWQRDTAELAGRVLDDGIRAVVTCVDNNVLPVSAAGREFDRAFLDALPAAVDPCGENGEFHTFVYAAGMFTQPVSWRLVETVDQGAFSCAIIGPDNEEPLNEY